MAATGGEEPRTDHSNLISPLILSFTQSLPFNARRCDFVLDEKFVESNTECLVALCQHCLDDIFKPMGHLLQILIKNGVPGEDETDREDVITSQKSILRLLTRCLQQQWDTYNMSSPPLEEGTVKHVIEQVYEIISCAKPGQIEQEDTVPNLAAVMVNKLTSRNFAVVYDMIHDKTKQLEVTTDEHVDLGILHLLKYLHFNKKRLEVLIKQLSTGLKLMKKQVQLAIGASLSSVIWSWISEYPGEFFALQTSDKKIADEISAIFSVFDILSEKQHRKAVCWPLQTRLLLLCPDTMHDLCAPSHTAAKDKDKDKEDQLTDYKRFWETLKKALTGQRAVVDIAVRCFVDVCIASTYLGQKENVFTETKANAKSYLQFLMLPIERELQSRLFDHEHPFFENIDATNEALLVNFLIACFRFNHKEVITDIMYKFIAKEKVPTITREASWSEEVAEGGKSPLKAMKPAKAAKVVEALEKEERKPIAVPVIFRIVVVKALLAIKEQGESMPWNPTIVTTYELLTSPLRREFQHLLQRILAQPWSAGAMKASKQKKDIKALNDLNQDLELLECIMQLFYKDPNLALFHSTTHSDAAKDDKSWYSVERNMDYKLQDTKKLMTGLTICLQDSRLTNVAETASKTLLKLHEPANVAMWNPDNMMNSFWDISSSVLLSLAVQLIGRRCDNTLQLMTWLVDVMASRNSFLQNSNKKLSERGQPQTGIPEGQNKANLVVTRHKVESVFLTQLCVSNPEIIQVAAEGFRRLCEETDILGVSDEDDNLLTVNLDVYRELAKTGGLVTGFRAQQKQIMHLLRCITVQTTGNLSAWDNVYSRWGEATDSLISLCTRAAEEGKDKDETVQAPKSLPTEWIAMTGLLCALGGVCLMAERPGLHAMSPSAANTNALEGSRRNVHRFIIRLLDLLTLEMGEVGVQVREAVKESLGQELSPALYSMLMEQCNARVSEFFNKTNNTVAYNSTNTLFIDQVIKIMRHLLESKIDGAAEQLALTDVESLVTACVDYLRQAGKEEDAQKTKIGFCAMMVSVMQHRQSLTFKHEMRFRNEMVEKLIEFVSADNMQQQSPHQGELDNMCVKAIAALLRNLPLQQLYDDETDQMEAKSKLFLKYFTFLMNVTNRCRDPSEVKRSQVRSAVQEPSSDAAEPPGVRRNTSEQKLKNVRRLSEANPRRLMYGQSAPNVLESQTTLSPKALLYQQERSQRQLQMLRDYSCQAMSNLLSANCDVGLGHSISMGYHEDEGVRLAFTEVLTKVLKQGTEFDTLAESVSSDRYAKLVSMITDSNLSLVYALNNVISNDALDEFAQAILNIFDAKSAVLPLLFRVAEWEVAQCHSAQTLFRRNSVATKLAAACARLYGQQYLRTVLQPILCQLRDSPAASYEIDESRLRPGEDLQQNISALQQLCLNIFTAIMDSIGDVSANLRMVCCAVRRATARAFPESQLNSVGGLLFLRFLTPALVSPHSHGVFDGSLPLVSMRGLLLASKALQAIANFAPFTGVKEAYMQVLNDFVTEKMPPLRMFLDSISTPPDTVESAVQTELARYHIALPGVAARVDESDPLDFVVKDPDLHVIHRLLADNLEKLGREMTSSKREVSDTGESRALLFDRLTTLLAQLGDPPKAELRDRRNSVSNASRVHDSKFEELMQRHREDGQAIFERFQAKNLFFEAGTSKAKRPVFYYIARRFNVTEMEPEQVFYFVLATLKSRMQSAFDLVIDLTLFGRDNEPSMEMIDMFCTYLHPNMIANLSSVLIFNPPSWFRAFAKRIHRYVYAAKLHKRIKYVTMPDLQTLLNDPALPPSTMRLVESKSEFSNVTKLGPQRKTVPVSVRVGSTAFQVISAEKTKILGSNTLITDFYSISNITEIPESSDDHLLIDYDHGGEKLTLTGPDVEAIKHAVTDVYQRYLLSSPENKSARKVIRPADVPGTLLNMALLNLGSPDPSLRLASYNFLAALTTTFDFHIGGELLEATGIAIPQNNSNFIIKISEYLSSNEPRLTLEFLDECIAGLSNSTTEQKHLCLEYMQPWLPNVKEFASGSPEKTLKIIRGLVDVTISEQELYPSLQAKVWYTIGRVDDLVVKVVDQFLKVAIDGGPGSHPATIMADAAVTLAAANVTIVSRMVIDRMLHTLAATSEQPQPLLARHPLYPDIQVLCRFLLMLSFNDRLNVLDNLADVFHIATMVLAVDPPIVKASIHGMLINVVQSLSTTLNLTDDALRAMHVSLTDMIEPKFCIMLGLPSTKTLPTKHVFESWGASKGSVDNFKLSSLASVVYTLWEVCSACQPQSAGWQRRWMELATACAFSENPALQPRAFVTLGQIAPQELPDGLLVRVLRTLQTALVTSVKGEDGNHESLLLESILMCLTNLLRLVPVSVYHKAMFWVSVGILQVKGSAYPAAISVLDTCLTKLNAHGAFERKSIQSVLMEARSHAADLCDILDSHSAISFTRSFSFAVAGVLLSGFEKTSSPATIGHTTRLLVSFLDVQREAENLPVPIPTPAAGSASATPTPTASSPSSPTKLTGPLPAAGPSTSGSGPRASLSRSSTVEVNASHDSGSEPSGMISTDMLGYVAGALPVAEEKRAELMSKGPSGRYAQILNSSVLREPLHAVLLIAFMCAKLERTEHTSELRFLYDFLAEAAKSYPEVFPLVNKHLKPKLQHVLTRTQDMPMIKSAQQILRTLISSPPAPGKELSPDFVEKSGFGGLFRLPNTRQEGQDLQREIDADMMRVCSQILGRFLVVGGETQDVATPLPSVPRVQQARYSTLPPSRHESVSSRVLHDGVEDDTEA
eukprot:m.255425 g.255425  ORF g.255425 m.255425 type:complete len:2782 (+) comp22689_c2_seq1:322-8667(+)